MQKLVVAVTVFAAALLHAAPGHAQSTRTWVMATGDDINPCSRTAPCKSFAGAIAKTAAGGEISVIDAGGYGTVTINKSVSIMAIGAEASVLSLTGPSAGITIAAGPNDVVLLDGVTFEGGGTGVTGISITSAGAVHIRNCVIRGFQGAPAYAINIAPTTNTQVFISNCAISKNRGGIQANPTGSGSAQVFLDRVQLDNNAGAALSSQGAAALVYLSASTITASGIGINAGGGGSVLSFGNNAVAGNQVDGAPTGTRSLQ